VAANADGSGSRTSLSFAAIVKKYLLPFLILEGEGTQYARITLPNLSLMEATGPFFMTLERDLPKDIYPSQDHVLTFESHVGQSMLDDESQLEHR